ncbi:unnamed protein product (mitochondrion) [Plasmodiophora brassicae]|uniref:Peptidase S54 rhomboid domain-containing protein n=1 Tax=Plasmodiophora brassicae TaxID=37360 RepID=A0A3P3Y8K5_PLABS|nr:unnamed protein product [Plasmodiophora brassicae]
MTSLRSAALLWAALLTVCAATKEAGSLQGGTSSPSNAGCVTCGTATPARHRLPPVLNRGRTSHGNADGAVTYRTLLASRLYAVAGETIPLAKVYLESTWWAAFNNGVLQSPVAALLLLLVANAYLSTYVAREFVFTAMLGTTARAPYQVARTASQSILAGFAASLTAQLVVWAAVIPHLMQNGRCRYMPIIHDVASIVGALLGGIASSFVAGTDLETGATCAVVYALLMLLVREMWEKDLREGHSNHVVAYAGPALAGTVALLASTSNVERSFRACAEVFLLNMFGAGPFSAAVQNVVPVPVPEIL